MQEDFLKRVYILLEKLKIVFIDENICDKIEIKQKKIVTKIVFKYKNDDSIIRGFLGLAEYFHSPVIRSKDKFYISSEKTLFRLEG